MALVGTTIVVLVVVFIPVQSGFEADKTPD
jgi:hypothetical protein